jgi:hypothetical protein
MDRSLNTHVDSDETLILYDPFSLCMSTLDVDVIDWCRSAIVVSNLFSKLSLFT